MEETTSPPFHLSLVTSGETTSTLTVDDDYNYNSYQYRCVLDSATAVATTTSNVATLTVYRVVTIGTQPLDQTPVAPAQQLLLLLHPLLMVPQLLINGKDLMMVLHIQT